jgi:hypothetical protein
MKRAPHIHIEGGKPLGSSGVWPSAARKLARDRRTQGERAQRVAAGGLHLSLAEVQHRDVVVARSVFRTQLQQAGVRPERF